MIFPMSFNNTNATPNQTTTPSAARNASVNASAPGLQSEQAAMKLSRQELVPENDQVEYRSTEEEDKVEDGRHRRGRKQGGEHECETCKNRKYQDGSNDPGVSFKTPTELDPGRAATAVRAHEQEHVVRNQAEAEREGREIVDQNVMIHTAICPECGRTYVSGGTTTTTTRGKSENEQANMLASQFTAGVPDAKGVNVDSDA